MTLTLITGSANSGKTGFVHRALLGALPEEMPTLVLPQAPDVRRAIREFAERGVSGLRVVDFDLWLDSLWALRGDGRRIIGGSARRAFVEQAIARSDLTAASSSARTPGFSRMIGHVVQRLILEPVPADAVSSEIARIVRAYTSLLDDAGLVEATQAARSLAADPPVLGGPVAFNRFTDLSPAQELLVVGLSRVNETFVALTWSDSSGATEALDPLIGRLRAEEAISVPAAEAPRGDEGLVDLGAALFSGRSGLPIPDSLTIGRADGREAECALAAIAAREAIDAGTAPEQVAITFRDLSRRVWLLERALQARGVAAVMDVALPFTATPYGAALFALLDACTTTDTRYERLSAFLATPYSGADPDAVAAVDADWRVARAEPEQLLRAAGRAVPEASKALRLAQAVCRSGAQAEEWKKLADSLLAAGTRSTGEAGVRGALDAAAHRRLLGAANELAESGSRVTAVAVLDALRGASVSTGAEETVGHVTVTEANRLRARRFSTLILGGLTSDEFSSERSDQLSEQMLQRLGQREAIDARKAERMLYYMVVTRARDRLFLLHQISRGGGAAARPSSFLEETLDAYRDVEQAAGGRMPEGLRVRRLSAAQLAESAPSFSSGRGEIRSQAHVDAPVPPRRGVIDDADVLEHLATRTEFSVSEIEAYLSCPYRWFYQRALRPREIDKEFDARERGTRAHWLLRAFYDAWLADGHSRVTLATAEQALELLDRVAQGADAATGLTRGLGERLSATRADGWVRRVIRDDAEFLPGFQPSHHEFPFGERHGRPVELWGVGLSGSIDRIETGDAGLVVIDYKSSKKVAPHASFAKEGLVQAPVYAAAASALLGRPVAGSIYRSLSSLECRGFWAPATVSLARGNGKDGADAERIGQIIEEAGERVRAAVDGIRRGDIGPDPLNAETCQHCLAASVCGRHA